MISTAIPLCLAVACAVLGGATYWLFTKEFQAQKDQALTDRTLYESGEAAAAASAKRNRMAFGPIARSLHSAGVETSPMIWASGVGGAAFVTGAFATTLFKIPLIGVAAGAAVCAAMWMRLALLRKRRQALLDQQFARVLSQLSASVRSSLTVERAMRIAAAHADEPLREELVRVLADTAYGTALHEAFERMAERTSNPDMRALAAATRVQQRFGGALAPVLDMIGTHANARIKASRELRTELSGTRLAKWFVAGSMPAIFLIMYVTNADFARFYMSEPLGWVVLACAAVMELGGLVACNRITKLDSGKL